MSKVQLFCVSLTVDLDIKTGNVMKCFKISAILLELECLFFFLALILSTLILDRLLVQTILSEYEYFHVGSGIATGLVILRVN